MGRLPVAPAPVPGELVWSYVRRLAWSNGLKPEFLHELVVDAGIPGDWGRCLGVLTGLADDSLRWAIPDLAAPWSAAKAWEMPIERRLERMVVGCPSCMAAKGAVDPVARWMPFHVRVCTVHETWLHSDDQDLLNSRRSPGAIRLRGLPELIIAQHRLANLARRRDGELLRVAYVEAYGVALRWAAQDRKDHDRWRRLDLLLGADSRWRVKAGDPALDAALFPELVSLLGLFSSPYWRNFAGADDSSREQSRLLSVVHERVGFAAYEREHPSHGPLRQWIRAQQTGAPPVSWLIDETRLPRWPGKESDYEDFTFDDHSLPKRVQVEWHTVSVVEARQPRFGFRLLRLASAFSSTCHFCHLSVASEWIAVRNAAGLRFHDTTCESCYGSLTGVHI
jgi:TniQ protein